MSNPGAESVSNRKDIFISYSSLDREFVDRVANDLRKRNVNVWLDRWDIAPGANIVTAINDGLAQSSQLLVVISENALRSRWVEEEWSKKFGQEVSSGQIAVIPTILGEVSEDDLPLSLRFKNRINLSVDYDGELERLVDFVLRERRKKVQEEVLNKTDMFSNAVKSFVMSDPEVSILEDLKSRLELSGDMSAERRVRLIIREIEFAHQEFASRESEIEQKLETDPNPAFMAMRLVIGRQEAQVHELKRKLRFLSSDSFSPEEQLENLEAEIRYRLEKRKLRDVNDNEAGA